MIEHVVREPARRAALKTSYLEDPDLVSDIAPADAKYLEELLFST